MNETQYARHPRMQWIHVEDQGYRRSLKPRQLKMIAVGGAVGTGLFLGTGKRLHDAGPGLFLAYALCGVLVFFILRALGELVLHRPSSGSFVSYAREFYGEKAAFVTGWMYFLNWAMAAIVDTTAIARYFHFWAHFRAIPQWLLALAALLMVLCINLIAVKWFGEMEFWVAMVKVVALVAFLLFGAMFFIGGFRIRGSDTGFAAISQHGGLFPNGLVPLVMVINGAVFAYAAAELVGTAAGETAEAKSVLPRAINGVIARLALFYVGSLVLLALMLPASEYRSGTSPFVTFFSRIGVANAGSVMNIVVLTAAVSSLNAGLYSTGRILRSMALNGSAPAFTGRISRVGVPYGGIVLTCFVALCGVLLNAWVPERAFEIGLNVASLGIIASWAMILLCQLKLWRWYTHGKAERPKFRMVGAPYTGIATLAALAVVPVLMLLDYPDGTWAASLLVVIIPALVIGWFAARRKVLALARKRDGYYGDFPAVAIPTLEPEFTVQAEVLHTEILDGTNLPAPPPRPVLTPSPPPPESTLLSAILSEPPPGHCRPQPAPPPPPQEHCRPQPAPPPQEHCRPQPAPPPPPPPPPQGHGRPKPTPSPPPSPREPSLLDAVLRQPPLAYRRSKAAPPPPPASTTPSPPVPAPEPAPPAVLPDPGPSAAPPQPAPLEPTSPEPAPSAVLPEPAPPQPPSPEPALSAVLLEPAPAVPSQPGTLEPVPSAVLSQPAPLPAAAAPSQPGETAATPEPEPAAEASDPVMLRTSGPVRPDVPFTLAQAAPLPAAFVSTPDLDPPPEPEPVAPPPRAAAPRAPVVAAPPAPAVELPPMPPPSVRRTPWSSR